jgi:hypothetical protein
MVRRMGIGYEFIDYLMEFDRNSTTIAFLVHRTSPTCMGASDFRLIISISKSTTATNTKQLSTLPCGTAPALIMKCLANYHTRCKHAAHSHAIDTTVVFADAI